MNYAISNGLKKRGGGGSWISYPLSPALLTIPHDQVGELVDHRIISLAKVLRLGEGTRGLEFKTGMQLRRLRVDLGDHVGHHGSRRIMGVRSLALELGLLTASERREGPRARWSLHLILHDLGGMLLRFLVALEDLYRSHQSETSRQEVNEVWRIGVTHL